MEANDESQEIELRVYNLLKNVIDPELGVNVIDMGLVYEIYYNQTEGIVVNHTLSSKNCPMGDIIIEDIKNVLKDNFPEHKHCINLVWEPEWTSDFITPNGKELLNMN